MTVGTVGDTLVSLSMGQAINEARLFVAGWPPSLPASTADNVPVTSVSQVSLVTIRQRVLGSHVVSRVMG